MFSNNNIPGAGTISGTTLLSQAVTNTETQTISCVAAGHPATWTGAATQTRSYTSQNGVKIAGTETAWVTTANTCVAPAVVAPLVAKNIKIIAGLDDGENHGIVFAVFIKYNPNTNTYINSSSCTNQKHLYTHYAPTFGTLPTNPYYKNLLVNGITAIDSYAATALYYNYVNSQFFECDN